ncbi:MAG: UDP-N-acetylmuramoyl-L-alanyl-D-glutamate--2,6-diaminopimelate ligase [Clostridia bacterium]|nr:UDP-N-acetylmuramoyl-L-alanyl-D-glutamate--2,6-diaminopimelate ligase [Clostridia bacterium]
MLFRELIQNISFRGIKNYKDVEIDNLTHSSTADTSNALYFCLRGSKVDGHNFAKAAVENGAVCLVVERFLDLPVPQILVDNARKAMSQVSAVFYEFDKSNIKFIGVTGTNGKTTTAFITRHILQNLGKRVGMIGTEGTYIGDIKIPSQLTTPDPIKLHKIIHDMDLSGVEYVVMEVSAHALALNKVDSIMYDVVGITNITQDHLDYFNSMENYARAKAELFTYNHAKKAIINIDDKYTRSIYKKCNIEKETLSLNKSADIMVEESNYEVDGTNSIINIGGKQYMLNSPLVGDYNLANLLMAAGFCNSLGFSVNEILEAFNKSKVLVPGRLNLIQTPKCAVVIDYAHTPDGIEKVLNAINKIKKGRLIVVFGCGGNRDSGKRPQMGEMATRLADYTIVTSDNPRYENPYQILADINKGITSKNNHINIENRESAIGYALNIAKPEDIVAILGKGNENYQEINGEKIPYSDYKAVDEYFIKTEDAEHQI